MLKCAWAVLTLLLCVGCSPDLNWREWRFDETGLVQTFPCKPIRQQRQVRLADREQVLVLHVCDADGATWALAHTTAADPASVEPLMRAMTAAAHANLGATPRAAAEHAVPGATPQAAAGRYTFDGQGPQGAVLNARVLVFARGLLVVQSTALGPHLPDGAVDMFFASMRAGS